MRKRLGVFFAGFVELAPAICAQPAISAVLSAASYSVTPTGNLTQSRQTHTAALLANGKVLIAGGYAIAAVPIRLNHLDRPGNEVTIAVKRSFRRQV